MKNEPRWDSITEGPFADHSADTHPQDVATDEARVILENWIKVATYKLPRSTVAEMLDYQAADLRA